MGLVSSTCLVAPSTEEKTDVLKGEGKKKNTYAHDRIYVNQCLENKPRICFWVILLANTVKNSRKLTLNYYTNDGFFRWRTFLLISHLKICLLWLGFITDFQLNAFAKIYFILHSLFYFLDTWKIRGINITLN